MLGEKLLHSAREVVLIFFLEPPVAFFPINDPFNGHAARVQGCLHPLAMNEWYTEVLSAVGHQNRRFYFCGTL